MHPRIYEQVREASDAAHLREPAAVYANARQVCARYGGVAKMTLWRWLADPRLSFPKPAFTVNGIRFWRLSDLDRWDAERAALQEREAG